MAEGKTPALDAASVTPQTRVLAALSGGADSVALLLMLNGALRAGRIAGLCAAHYHHGLRGAEADGDLAFCRELCGRLNVPFTAGYGDIPALCRETRRSEETEARIRRYAFLEETRIKTGCDCVAVAHHMDDQAETVLMHLIRGTGPKGLAGMRPRTGSIVRPLLGFTHAELKEYVAAQGETWREDGTNALPEGRRNRVRLEIIPLLKTENPQIVRALAGLSEKLCSDEDYFEPVVTALLKDAELPGGYDRAALASAAESVRRRALMRLAAAATGNDFTEEDTLRLERLLTSQSGRTEVLTGGCRFTADGPVLRPLEENGPAPAEMPLPYGETVLFGGWAVRAEHAERFERPGNRFTACFRERGPLSVRFPAGGDTFAPLGLGGHRLLSDIFTDRKVPRAERRVPLICSGGEILFVPGYTVAESVRAGEDTKECTLVRVWRENQ